jgi:signal recognition particle receptor subunit beta
MSFVNFADNEVQLKIVYYGPGLGGKTTCLQHVHEAISEDDRGELTSVATSKDRTLFFDFMPLVANAIEGFTTRFQMYTVPGQVMYNTTRKLVLRGVDGVVFVADSQWEKMPENVESFKNLIVNLEEQGDSIETMPYVLHYNKRDLNNIAPVRYMEFLLNNRSKRTVHFETVATDGDGVFPGLNMIARMVLHDFIEKHSAGGKTKKEVEKEELVLV